MCKCALKTDDKENARIFKENRNNYVMRKIKKELSKLPNSKHVSRRQIGRLMKILGLVSNYTVAKYKPQKSSCYEELVKNELQCQFNQEESLSVITSDLSYVRVGTKWHYVCLFVDLFNRDIIGHSADTNKSAELSIRLYQLLKVTRSMFKCFIQIVEKSSITK